MEARPPGRLAYRLLLSGLRNFLWILEKLLNAFVFGLEDHVSESNFNFCIV
jgi:hypothetical protein